mgnify:CR=1 FL=1
MAKPEIVLLSVGLSSKCNRYCSHCSQEADMNGKFLRREQVDLLSREISKAGIRYQNLFFDLQFTGDGEALLHPEMVENLDIIMQSKAKLKGVFITSGADPDSRLENRNLQKLLQRPYAKKMTFCLSFNLFQKNYGRRLIHTLDELFRAGIKEAVIKVCLPLNHRETINRLEKLIRNWAGDIFLSNGASHHIKSVINEKELKEAFPAIDRYSKEELEEINQKKFVEIRPPSEFDLQIFHEFYLILCKEKLAIETKYGPRVITYAPHLLTGSGRAKKIKDQVPKVSTKGFCEELKKPSTGVYLAPDGYYYPSTYCPRDIPFRLGHVSEDLRQIYGKKIKTFRRLFKAILSDASSREQCAICLEEILKK